MSDPSNFSDIARRLRRTDLLLLRAVRRQRARPAMRAKGQFWGSVITDDEVEDVASLAAPPSPIYTAPKPTITTVSGKAVAEENTSEKTV